MHRSPSARIHKARSVCAWSLVLSALSVGHAAAAPMDEAQRPNETEAPAEAAPASEDPPAIAQCMAWHASAQELRYNSRLLAAREPLRSCHHEACPELVRTDCAGWLLEVEQALPSAKFSATVDGAPAEGLSVLIDGAELDISQTHELDPGQYAVRFQVPGRDPIDRTVVLRNGDKNQIVLAEFTTRVADPSRDVVQREEVKERPVLAMTWVLGALSLASAGTSAGLWFSARSDYDKLESVCAPNCTQDQTKTTETKLLFADIGVGVAVAAGVGAVVTHVTRPEVVRSRESIQKRSLRLGASISPTAAFVTVRGNL